MHYLKNGLFVFLCFVTAGYAIFAYAFMPLGALLHPDMKSNFIAHSVGIYLHIFGSVIALILGPFQFFQYLRQRYTNTHRWLGRVYLLAGVLVGGLAGLYMSAFAYGGIIAKLGFATLAVLWLYTGLRAYLAVRNGAINEHRQWMIRNFALTFAAVMLRLYLPAFMSTGIEFSLAYAIISWLCWVPNLIVAEWKYVTTNNTREVQLNP